MSFLFRYFCWLLAMVAPSLAISTEQPSKPENSTNSFGSEIRALQIEGIDNFFRLSEKFYSGSTPANPEAFAALTNLGIKTIISVDGAVPDALTAKKSGMRYVHLPMGYGRIPTNDILRLIHAAGVLPKPIYVHCHHGKHRGPTAVALMCMASESWTPDEALVWMHRAGTSTNYPGLYKVAQDFRMPAPALLDGLPKDFPEKANVPKLVDFMVALDERFEHLKLIKAAQFRQPSSHPDVDSKHEAVLFHELITEFLRAGDMKSHSQDFILRLKDAKHIASELETCLSQPKLDVEKASGLYDKISNSCASCHKEYRN